MIAGGAFLDIAQGMKPVICAVDSSFSVNRTPAAEEPVGEFSPAAEKCPRQVLVVDDEPLIRWSVAESLADLGFDVREAADARTALRSVTTTRLPFDIVVLDLRLPDMEDLSLLATLRQLLPLAALILMTAFGTPELIAEARALGAEVLNKPFELDELKRLVQGSAPETA
jgi:DNA-binding NtrC family response regulator